MNPKVGDIVRMRKAHPCGSFEWVVSRVGADIGLKCTRCGRKVMLTREEFNHSLKSLPDNSAAES
jgi:hypothetical protein